VRVQLAEALQGVVSQLLLPTKDRKGRVAAFEIMVATVAIRNLIREGKTHQMPSSIQTGTQLGMQSLEQALRNLVMQGRIDRAHADGVLQSTSSGSTLGPAPTAAPAAAAR
jgi:twitching motility protein PilT